MLNLYIPTIIYIVFSFAQILIDINKSQYDIAITKSIITIIISILLQYLCNKDYEIIAWLIVLLPFLFISIIMVLLIKVIRFNPSTGSISNINNKSNSIQLISSMPTETIITSPPPSIYSSSPMYISK